MHLIEHRRAQKLLSRRAGSAAVARLESKFLNQRVDSPASGALSQFAERTKKNSQILQGGSRETEFFKRFASLWG
jgi:hypothetical protein